MPISHMGCVLSLLMVPVKIIMNKLTGLLEECGFVEFIFHAAAERALYKHITEHRCLEAGADLTFRLNWASSGAGDTC